MSMSQVCSGFIYPIHWFTTSCTSKEVYSRSNSISVRREQSFLVIVFNLLLACTQSGEFSIFTSREAAWSSRSVGRKKRGDFSFLVIVTSVFGVFATFLLS